MKVAFFDSHQFEREVFNSENKNHAHELVFYDCRLTQEFTGLAHGYDVVCCFVNDRLDAATLKRLKENGVKLVALRSAGFNHVDLTAAAKLDLPVVRVPEYSPYAVAEHTVALVLTLNRKIHRAYTRVRELNFSLEGLVGFDMHGKTVGVVGTGRIGRVMVKILHGFGCNVLAYDLKPDPELVSLKMAQYVELNQIYRDSDVISLHIPLQPQTKHIIDARALAQMKPQVLLVNTGRGALIDTPALIEALKKHMIGGAALDVYEEEEGIFFSDHSIEGINDDLLARLLTFPNVLVTSHQAFLTNEALKNIAGTTLSNITEFEKGLKLSNRVSSAEINK
ncbi:MAG: 2-hydroxyacid dehydrogenase [Bdellovibrionota bacterium]